MNTTEIIELDGIFFNETTLEEIATLKLNEGSDLSINHKKASLSEKDLEKAKEGFCKNCGEHNPKCKLFILNRGSRLCKEFSEKNPHYESSVHIWRVLG